MTLSYDIEDHPEHESVAAVKPKVEWAPTKS